MVLLPLSLALLRVLLKAAELVRPVALLDSTEDDLGCADAECILPLAGLFSFEDMASSGSSCSSSEHVEKIHMHTHTCILQVKLCTAVLKRQTRQKCVNLKIYMFLKRYKPKSVQSTYTHTHNPLNNTHNRLHTKCHLGLQARLRRHETSIANLKKAKSDHSSQLP